MMSRGWLALDTPPADWAFSVDVTVAGNTDTYTNSAIGARAAMDAMVTWANGLLRPWFGSTTFSWQHTSYTGRGAPKLVSSGAPFDFAPDAQAQVALGIAPEAGTMITDSSTGALGAWYPAAGVSLIGWLRSLGDGDAAGNGAVRGGVPALARFAPPVDAVASAIELAVLPEILRSASVPRRGQIYDPANAAWRSVSVGGYTQERQEGGWYLVRLTVRGEAL